MTVDLREWRLLKSYFTITSWFKLHPSLDSRMLFLDHSPFKARLNFKRDFCEMRNTWHDVLVMQFVESFKKFYCGNYRNKIEFSEVIILQNDF